MDFAQKSTLLLWIHLLCIPMHLEIYTISLWISLKSTIHLWIPLRSNLPLWTSSFNLWWISLKWSTLLVDEIQKGKLNFEPQPSHVTTIVHKNILMVEIRRICGFYPKRKTTTCRGGSPATFCLGSRMQDACLKVSRYIWRWRFHHRYRELYWKQIDVQMSAPYMKTLVHTPTPLPKWQCFLW